MMYGLMCVYSYHSDLNEACAPGDLSPCSVREGRQISFLNLALADPHFDSHPVPGDRDKIRPFLTGCENLGRPKRENQ